MSNERFDKLMKKNLESVRPGYQPATWDRFRKRLPVVGFWPWMLQYGGWLLSGLMLAGWLVTLYTLRENQQVIRQLSTRATPVQPRPVAPAAPRPALTSSHRVDTVYIVQRTVVEHRHVYEPAAGGPELSDNTRPRYGPKLAAGNPVAAESSRIPSSVDKYGTVAQPTIASRPTEQTSQPAQTINPAAAPTTTRPAGKGIQMPNPSPVNSNPVPGNPAHGTDPVPTLPTPADSVNRTIAAATATMPVDSIRAEPKRAYSIKTDSAAQKPLATPVAAPMPAAQPAEQRRPPFRLSSLQPRIGVETVGTLNGAGVGPALELFPTENFGISVGVQASQSQLEEHKGLRDFNAITGTEFVEQYRANLPAQYDRIEDISVRTSLVSLPVTLKYYVPLRRSWSLMFQAGTSFDVAAYQQVRYESYFQGEEQSHAFEINAQPRFFHNFTFGAGVQYRRPRISAQLSPYYLYDFRSLINTPAGSNVGVKASVWLDLFK